MSYQAIADMILVLHWGVAAFVVLGLPVIVVGNWLGWTWVNHRGWRLAHLAAIGIVVVQAWLGRYCALTELESSLREQAGQPGYEQSFIAHWAQRLLYFEAPLWVFALIYTGFGLLVVVAWRRYPPKGGKARGEPSRRAKS